MNKNVIYSMSTLILLILSLSACSTILSPEKSLPLTHPEKLPEARPVCADCHEGNLSASLKPFASFNHTDEFVKDHKGSGARDERVCAVCHAKSFCADCHTNKREVKPSVKMGDRIDRQLIHRGDYMTLHKIDGKRDPAQCYRCHGRSNNALCQSCHR